MLHSSHHIRVKSLWQRCHGIARLCTAVQLTAAKSKTERMNEDRIAARERAAHVQVSM